MNSLFFVPKFNTTKIRLKEDEEFSLLKKLGAFRSVIEISCRACEPYLLANYLLALCTLFSSFYEKCRVLSDDKKLTEARISLVWCIRTVILKGLSLLGLRCPEKM